MLPAASTASSSSSSPSKSPELMSSISWRRSSISSSRDSMRALWSGFVSLASFSTSPSSVPSREPFSVDRSLERLSRKASTRAAGSVTSLTIWPDWFRRVRKFLRVHSSAYFFPESVPLAEPLCCSPVPGACRRSCSRKASTSAWNCSSGSGARVRVKEAWSTAITQGAERVSAQAGPLVRSSRSRSRVLMASADDTAERDTRSPSAARGWFGVALRGSGFEKLPATRLTQGPVRIYRCLLPYVGAHWNDQLKGDDHAQENDLDHGGGLCSGSAGGSVNCGRGH